MPERTIGYNVDVPHLPAIATSSVEKGHLALAEPQSNIDELILGVRNGDNVACHEFWGIYGPLIERVAQRHLSGDIRRRVGPETVTLSACRTFFRRAQLGEFELSDADGLWRLLCAITVNKVRTKARHHRRQKRNYQDEVPVDAQPEIHRKQSTPDEEAEFNDELEHLIDQFDEDEREVLDLKLQHFTNEQIAESLECSERTVRRMMKRIQSKIGEMFDGQKP